MAARQGVLAAIIAFTVIAAPAEATIRKGSVNDPASDTTGTAGHDILQAVGVSDDSGGSAAVAMRLAGTPAANAFVSGALGTLQGDGTCGAPFAVFSGYIGNGSAAWARDNDAAGTSQPATLTVDGPTVTLAATSPRLALPFDCAYASTRNVNNQIYDETTDFPLAVDTPPAATPRPPRPRRPPRRHERPSRSRQWSRARRR